MAGALGGLVDAYVDSDEGEGEEAAQSERSVGNHQT